MYLDSFADDDYLLMIFHGTHTQGQAVPVLMGSAVTQQLEQACPPFPRHSDANTASMFVVTRAGMFTSVTATGPALAV